MSDPDTRLTEAVKQAELAAEDMADDHPRYADAVEKLAWLLGECRRQVYGDDRARCPDCGTPVESREPFDSQQNTRLQPCGCIVAAGDLQAAYEESNA